MPSPPTIRIAGGLGLFFALLVVGTIGGLTATRTWTVQATPTATSSTETVTASTSVLWPLIGQSLTEAPEVETETYRSYTGEQFSLTVSSQIGPWSILPAATAILLCFVFRDPVVALLGGRDCRRSRSPDLRHPG